MTDRPQYPPGTFVSDAGVVSIVLADEGDVVLSWGEAEDEQAGYQFAPLQIPAGQLQPASAELVANVLRDYDQRAGEFITGAFSAFASLAQS